MASRTFRSTGAVPFTVGSVNGKELTDDSYYDASCFGSVVSLSASVQLNSGGASSGWVTVGTIPTAYKPKKPILTLGFYYTGQGTHSTYPVRLTSPASGSGSLQIMALPNDLPVMFNVTYQI